APIGSAEDDHAANSGMTCDRLFDLSRAHIHRTPEDDVLHPTGHGDIALVIHYCTVARREPAVRQELAVAVVVCPIPQRDLLTAHLKLTLFAWLRWGSIAIEDPHLHPRHR